MNTERLFLNFTWHPTKGWGFACEDVIPEETQDAVSGLFEQVRDTLQVGAATGGVVINKETNRKLLFILYRKRQKKFAMIVSVVSDEMTAEDIEREESIQKSMIKLLRNS